MNPACSVINTDLTGVAISQLGFTAHNGFAGFVEANFTNNLRIAFAFVQTINCFSSIRISMSVTGMESNSLKESPDR